MIFELNLRVENSCISCAYIRIRPYDYFNITHFIFMRRNVYFKVENIYLNCILDIRSTSNGNSSCLESISFFLLNYDNSRKTSQKRKVKQSSRLFCTVFISITFPISLMGAK
jgi:hypothetical protein